MTRVLICFMQKLKDLLENIRKWPAKYENCKFFLSHELYNLKYVTKGPLCCHGHEKHLTVALSFLMLSTYIASWLTGK